MKIAEREGSIVSYVPEKGYGFIKGNDGNSYHFKKADLQAGEDAPGAGSQVQFEAVATDRGFSAVQVKSIAAPLEMWATPQNFLVTEHSTFSDAEIVFTYDIPCFAMAELHDEARQRLIDVAVSFGATGLIHLRSYSVGPHRQIQMEGTMVLAQVRAFARSPAEQEASAARIAAAHEIAIAEQKKHENFINANVFSKVEKLFHGRKAKVA